VEVPAAEAVQAVAEVADCRAVVPAEPAAARPAVNHRPVAPRDHPDRLEARTAAAVEAVAEAAAEVVVVAEEAAVVADPAAEVVRRVAAALELQVVQEEARVDREVVPAAQADRDQGPVAAAAIAA